MPSFVLLNQNTTLPSRIIMEKFMRKRSYLITTHIVQLFSPLMTQDKLLKYILVPLYAFMYVWVWA